MTEAEWQTCNNPEQMLEFLRSKASDRKLRLFAVACCRRCKRRLNDEENRRVMDAAESFVDGKITAKELAAARNATASWISYVAAPQAQQAALKVVTWASEEEGWQTCEKLLGIGPYPYRNASWIAERKAQTDILRDIFITPSRPITFDAAWLTPSVVTLATEIYGEHVFNHLRILADALEDAGCDDANILDHCRQAEEHVRGCWVVDLILDKQ